MYAMKGGNGDNCHGVEVGRSHYQDTGKMEERVCFKGRKRFERRRPEG